MKYFLLIIFCLFVTQNTNGQDVRRPHTEDEIKLIEALKNDKEFLRVDCKSTQYPKMANDSAEIRARTYETFIKAKETIKIKKTCGTREGDPIYSYLTIDKGKAFLVIDTTKDKFGSMRIYSHQCAELFLGKYFYDETLGRMIFHKLKSIETSKEDISLQCVSDKKEYIF